VYARKVKRTGNKSEKGKKRMRTEEIIPSRLNLITRRRRV